MSLPRKSTNFDNQLFLTPIPKVKKLIIKQLKFIFWKIAYENTFRSRINDTILI